MLDINDTEIRRSNSVRAFRPLTAKATDEELKQANEWYERHLKACKRTGMQPELKMNFIEDTLRDMPKLGKPGADDWTPENVSEGLNPRRYDLYQTPKGARN